jgi:HEAT repeat protein
MDTRSSSLVVGLYLLAAILIVGIVAGTFYGRKSRLEEQLARQAAEAREASSAASTAYLRRNAVSRQDFLAAEATAEVDRLRRQLEEKNRTLEERTTALRQRTAEYQKLQQEFDAAANLLLQSLALPMPPKPEAEDPPDSDDEDTLPVATAETPADAAALREELSKARLLENALSEEVEQLQAEVLAAEAALARLQEDARRQAEQLLGEERLLREVAGETLVRIGEPAIPALVELLKDESATVRRWAALVLADLGPAAPSALGPLMDALADRDESVRLAAAQALRAMTERE